MELNEKYTERRYICKQELYQEFDAHIAHVMWDEILRYRNTFRYDLRIMKEGSFLTLCRNTTFRMMEIEQQLYQITSMIQEKVMESETDVFWNQLQHQLDTIWNIDMNRWFINACDDLQFKEIEQITGIFQMNAPIVLRLFLLMLLGDNNQQNVCHLFLLKERLMPVYVMLFSQNTSRLCITGINLDVTYAFLEFLEQIQLKISCRMLLLNGSDTETHLETTAHELTERYPQLSDEQLAFFVSHRTQEHYYTIAQYVQFCDVCYETARNALDQLVEMCWYQKRKLGKKFIYFI